MEKLLNPVIKFAFWNSVMHFGLRHTGATRAQGQGAYVRAQCSSCLVATVAGASS